MKRSPDPHDRWKVSPRACMIAGVLGICLSLPTSSVAAQMAERENDWLLALPTCALAGAHQSGPISLMYPKPGLPAVVRQGNMLVARVRLPTPLTPPPGYQQDRALRGWSVSLVASHSHAIGGAEHGYELRVADVRPDGHTSLVFRASIPIPAWIAPGTYDLRIQGPHAGVAVSVASVVVLRPDQTIRLARLTEEQRAFSPDSLMRLETAPVDIWVTDVAGPALRRPLVGTGLAWIDLHHPGAILAVDSQIWALGGCSGPFSSFEEIRGQFGESSFASDTLRTVPTPAPLALLMHDRGGSVSATPGAELFLVFPDDGLATDFTGAEEVLWWPSSPLRRAGHRTGLVAQITASGPLIWSRSAEPAQSVSITRLDSGDVAAGHPAGFRASLEGGGSMTTVWLWAEESSEVQRVQGASEHEISFLRVDAQPLFVWAVDSRGRTSRSALFVEVQTERPGCAVGQIGQTGQIDSVGQSSRSRRSSSPVFFGALLLSWYGWRRTRGSRE